MRVLIVVWGWRSHLYPLVPTIWALRAAGDDVLVAGHPSLVAAITAAGLPAVALGPDLDFAAVFQGQIGAVQSGGERPAVAGEAVKPEISPDGGVVRLADAMLPDLIELGRVYQPDLIVHEQLNLAAAIAAAVLGVPSVRHLWGPDSSTELALDADVILAPRAARYGCDRPVRVDGNVSIDPCPPELQVAMGGPAHPVRFLPYNGRTELPRWLWAPTERPRIALTWGTMMADAGLDGRAVPAVLTALADLDAEIVLALEPAQRDRLGVLPPNVRAATAPLALHLLLPSCRLIVHQGGAGTLMTAVAAGVPQLIVPQVSDQHFNAWRLIRAGAGAQPAGGIDDPGALRALADDMMHAGYWHDNAARLRAAVAAAPSPADVVPTLHALADPGRAPDTRGAR